MNRLSIMMDRTLNLWPARAVKNLDLWSSLHLLNLNSGFTRSADRISAILALVRSASLKSAKMTRTTTKNGVDPLSSLNPAHPLSSIKTSKTFHSKSPINLEAIVQLSSVQSFI